MPRLKSPRVVKARREPTARQFAELLRECVEKGARVMVDGLGTFECGPDGKYMFTRQTEPKVFLAYVEEDFALARKLYGDLRARGCDPWLDRMKLLPGQNWPRAIEQAISVSDYFLALFSRHSVYKRGQFPSELRYALDCACHLPLDEEYFIPVRLDNCRVPARIERSIQYVDLFPEWEAGVEQLVKALLPKH
ncbi:MAG: toll/interleukin-1 receptor domain-containing protein [Acidobacteria bacterium]|nr:toll/interleukin-1 receptor domain-containing protein [Acidobacteriota bacterium]